MSNNPQKDSIPFVIAFLSPTLIGKICILYFGNNYSKYPGDGYGWGLLVSVIFTVTMLGSFLWRFRNYDDS